MTTPEVDSGLSNASITGAWRGTCWLLGRTVSVDNMLAFRRTELPLRRMTQTTQERRAAGYA